MYIPGTTRLHIPLAHPSCSYYYSLSPNILFLHISIVLHFLFYCTFYSLILFFTYIYALVLCYFYIIFIFILLPCPLSGPDLIYISLLIIPCIIYYVMNKQTLNLEVDSLTDELKPSLLIRKCHLKTRNAGTLSCFIKVKKLVVLCRMYV